MYCQMRFKLCQHISNFISASVALGRRFNAASEKENNTERIYIHMFYIQMSIHFLIKSFLKTSPSLWLYDIDE